MSSVRQIYLNAYDLAARAAASRPRVPNRPIDGHYSQPRCLDRRAFVPYEITSFLYEDPYRESSELWYSFEQDAVFTAKYLSVDHPTWRIDTDFVPIYPIYRDASEPEEPSDSKSIHIDLANIMDEIEADDIEVVCRRNVIRNESGLTLSITIKF